ncbi:MAG: hypothetical protein CBB66_06220 [bacterium TMED6]|nr:MAG: hypothetical protein CBB66_06220 [bacterium TMED6]|tara:strand:- start:19972 stop:20748 length:777 start_codon:yes stop_codon:yes gene_type:complete
MIKFFIFIFIIINSVFCKNTETLGLVTKTKGKVEYQKYSDKKFTTDIYKGLGLYGNDRIRTGDNGFSIYRYLDDASSIKILKNSDIRIEGRIKSRSIVKNVEINNGVLNFNIDNQADEYFTIVTPTSVATVKGTEFWLICNGPEGDKFLGIEGEVEIKNIESGRTVILTEDTQVLSTSNGNISTQNMSIQELDQIEDLEQENGNYDGSSDIDTGFDDSSGTQDDISGDSNINSDSENILRIELEDSLGNTKEIIIKYK